MGVSMSWTDERVELLRQLWLDGKSASQISSILAGGVTRNAVIGKVHRLGLAGRPKSPAVAAAPVRSPRARVAPQRLGSALAQRPRSIGNTALAFSHDYEIEAQNESDRNVVLPMSIKVTIVDLKESMCKWPLGDPATPEFRYCGASSTESPYCTFHAKLAYQPTQDRRKARAGR